MDGHGLVQHFHQYRLAPMDDLAVPPVSPCRRLCFVALRTTRPLSTISTTDVSRTEIHETVTTNEPTGLAIRSARVLIGCLTTDWSQCELPVFMGDKGIRIPYHTMVLLPTNSRFHGGVAIQSMARARRKCAATTRTTTTTTTRRRSIIIVVIIVVGKSRTTSRMVSVGPSQDRIIGCFLE